MNDFMEKLGHRFRDDGWDVDTTIPEIYATKGATRIVVTYIVSVMPHWEFSVYQSFRSLEDCIFFGDVDVLYINVLKPLVVAWSSIGPSIEHQPILITQISPYVKSFKSELTRVGWEIEEILYSRSMAVVRMIQLMPTGKVTIEMHMLDIDISLKFFDGPTELIIDIRIKSPEHWLDVLDSTLNPLRISFFDRPVNAANIDPSPSWWEFVKGLSKEELLSVIRESCSNATESGISFRDWDDEDVSIHHLRTLVGIMYGEEEKAIALRPGEKYGDPKPVCFLVEELYELITRSNRPINPYTRKPFTEAAKRHIREAHAWFQKIIIQDDGSNE